MSTYELVANLRMMNRWRRGEDDALLMPPPEVVGKWIDAAADALEVAADAAVAQEQNAHQYVELNRKFAELAGALRKIRDDGMDAAQCHALALAAIDAARKEVQP